MSFKTLLYRLFNVRKSSYTLTEEEIGVLSEEKTPSLETTIVDVDAIETDHEISNQNGGIYQELITSIYDEAKVASDLEDHNIWAVDFSVLESYQNLKEKSRQEQKELVLFLANLIMDQNKNRQKVEKTPYRFKFEIINKLLRFQLPFNENEIWSLLAFYISEQNRYWISLKLIINQLKTCATKKQLSKPFLKYLKSFLTSKALHSTSFDSYTNQITILQRILQNNAGFYRQNGIPLYLLIADHFGDFVNKKILASETEQKEALSEIMYKFSNYPNVDSPKSYYNIIKFLVPIVGLQELETYCKIFIERAVLFKPKVRTIYSRTDYRGDFYYYEYKPISKENLTVLRGFVFLAAYFKLENCLTLLHKLIERSYSKTNEVALGNGHKLVGEICIHILIHYFENKGHKILLALYQNTKFNSIKSRIKKETDKLEGDNLFCLPS